MHLQRTIGSQMTMKRTPRLTFRADPAIAAGSRVEELLRGLHEGESPATSGSGRAPVTSRAASRRRRRHGLVVVDKEAGWTSHDVVARCRRIFGQRRVGHAGTLDPDATGVLLVGLGRATRLMRFLTALPKTYTTDIVLGHGHVDARRLGRGHWHLRHGARDARRRWPPPPPR